jgi:hypothetical protein
MLGTRSGVPLSDVLKQLRSFSAAGGFERLRRAFDDPELKGAELAKLVKPELLSFIILLQQEEYFNKFAKTIPQEKPRADLAAARKEVLASKLPDLAKSAAAKELFSEAMGQLESSNPFITEFGSINVGPLWGESESALFPLVRVRLTSARGKTVFDETIDLDELSFLSLSFAELLLKEIERAKKMTAARTVEVVNSEEILNRIEQLRSLAEKLHSAKEAEFFARKEGADGEGDE